MIFTWFSHDFHMIFTWFSHNFPVIFSSRYLISYIHYRVKPFSPYLYSHIECSFADWAHPTRHPDYLLWAYRWTGRPCRAVSRSCRRDPYRIERTEPQRRIWGPPRCAACRWTGYWGPAGGCRRIVERTGRRGRPYVIRWCSRLSIGRVVGLLSAGPASVINYVSFIFFFFFFLIENWL